MAINNVRSLIGDIIEEKSLTEFHKVCATTDKLFAVMERTTDPEQAYGMCIGWATSVIKLAHIEFRLLSAALPQLEAELKDIVKQTTPLIQRREDARKAVYDLRGPDHDVRPLSMKTDPRRAEEVREAREHAKQVSIEVLAKLRPIQEDAGYLQSDIGAIKRSLRVLDHFVQHRFPVPTRTPRLRGQSAGPSGVDPISDFATKYVANMDNRDKEDATRKVLRDLRAHPVNSFDKLGQEIH